ncbi:hypothetical protein BTVI_15713 [Pitangus sulphuratus]|nr:hypothetical protein BTVI_15713 [Pitangus sulphuratus]
MGSVKVVGEEQLMAGVNGTDMEVKEASTISKDVGAVAPQCQQSWLQQWAQATQCTAEVAPGLSRYNPDCILLSQGKSRSLLEFAKIAADPRDENEKLIIVKGYERHMMVMQYLGSFLSKENRTFLAHQVLTRASGRLEGNGESTTSPDKVGAVTELRAGMGNTLEI